MSATLSRVEEVKAQLVEAMSGIQTSSGYRNDVKAVYTVPVAKKDNAPYPHIVVMMGKARTAPPSGNPATVFHTSVKFIITGAIEVRGLVDATSSKMQDSGESLLHDIKRVLSANWISHIDELSPDGTERRSWIVKDGIEEDRIVIKDQNVGMVRVMGEIFIDSQGPSF